MVWPRAGLIVAAQVAAEFERPVVYQTGTAAADDSWGVWRRGRAPMLKVAASAARGLSAELEMGAVWERTPWGRRGMHADRRR